MDKNVHVFPNGPAVARAFANHLRDRVNAKNGNFSWALSGGSTPKILFKLLAEEYRDAIEWSKVWFFWGDDRHVPHDDPESNYGESRKLLLDHLPIKTNQVFPVRTDLDPEAAARDYAATLIKMLPQNSDGLPIFDMNMLGMGGDGHTASIFPNSLDLMKNSEVCVVATHPESGQKRVTITGPVIAASDEIAFLITGAGKADRLGQIFHKEAGYETLPVSHVEAKQGELHWFLDEAAAAKL